MISGCKETLLVVMFALYGFAYFTILGKLCEYHVYNLGYVLVNSEFTLDLQTISFFIVSCPFVMIFCFDTNFTEFAKRKEGTDDMRTDCSPERAKVNIILQQSNFHRVAKLGQPPFFPLSPTPLTARLLPLYGNSC